jgi:MoaA/NifB/PqqE/SkfB family radical SAM enzyme
MHKISPCSLYLAIAFLKQCNFACGYCHPFGESKITHGENMTCDELKQVIDAAHQVGFRVYRFTGGECTILPWFSEIVNYALEKSSDVRINICTNGSTLDQYIDLYSFYKDRVGLRISLDSLDESKRTAGIDKIMTPKLYQSLQKLSESGVYARFNTVVTSVNVEEVLPIVSVAAQLSFDVKLLDLYVQDQYIATHGKQGNYSESSSPFDYWMRNYVDLNSIVPQLRDICDEEVASYNKDGGLGIPMYAFNVSGIKVILKDSTRGAFYSKSKCIDSCNRFGLTCQEGVYTPHVSSNMRLHINGCHHQSYQWDLRGQSLAAQVNMFTSILECFQDLEHIQQPPETIAQFLG